MMEALADPCTGALLGLARAEARPHDPEVRVWSGRLSRQGSREEPTPVGGAGWTDEAARGACLGEALERYDTSPRRSDGPVTASYEAWPLCEPAVPPEAWVGFSDAQFADPAFPLARFDAASIASWIRFRSVPEGDPWWVPSELAYLGGTPGCSHHHFPGISTGLAAGAREDGLVLRALQEVVERDGAVGAWWGAYPLRELDPDRVFGSLGRDRTRRLRRPNLEWRFFRVASPFTSHLVVVLLRGEDREGGIVSVGSACRSTRREALEKAALEAVQGRHWVRRMAADPPPVLEPPLRDFAAHALYYTLHPEELVRTPFATALPDAEDEATGREDRGEDLAALRAALGPGRPILVRDLTPRALAAGLGGIGVVRVLVPGLQPLYGDDLLAPLGGPMGARLGLAGLAALPPHPYP